MKIFWRLWVGVFHFSTLISRLPKVDIFDFARKQLPVMTDFAVKTAGVASLADYRKHYLECVAEMERLA